MSVFKNLRLLWGLLILSACNPYSDLDNIDKELFSSFPRNTVTSNFAQSDTIIYYTSSDLKANLKKIDSLNILISQIMPAESWKEEKRILHQEIISHLHNLQQYFYSFQKDPSLYNLSGKLYQILHSSDYSKEEKIKWSLQNLNHASKYYRNAMTCIQQAEADKLSLAIQKQIYGMRFLNEELRDSLNNWIPKEQKGGALDKKIFIANLSSKDFVAFCNSLLKEQQDSQFQHTK